MDASLIHLAVLLGIGATMKPKPTFEQCLDYIEATLGVPLLYWQKHVLRYIYDEKDKPYSIYVYGVRGGWTVLRQAEQLLREQIRGE